MYSTLQEGFGLESFSSWKLTLPSKVRGPIRTVLPIGSLPYLVILGDTLCYLLQFFAREFPQKMLRNILSCFTQLEVSLEFPDTLKLPGGLYRGVSTIFSHFWWNYFYADRHVDFWSIFEIQIFQVFA